MSIQITLIRCTAEKERINKEPYFNGSWVCSGNLKDDTSIINPVIRIKKSTPPPNNNYNYMYIPAFNRYYFIEDITNESVDFWTVRAKVDVLQTYQTDILNSKVVIDKTEEPNKANLYFDDGSFVTESRKYNQVLKFPSGLPQQGYNILICAGGL